MPRNQRKNPVRILVVRPDRVGDVVLSTPVYHTLKQSFSDCYVGALVSSYTSPLLKENPYIDAVITDDGKRNEVGGSSFRAKIKEISSHKFDIALVLMPTKRHAYMAFLAGIPYRVGVGHILYEVITMMHGVSRRKYNPLRHESDYMLDLVRSILPPRRAMERDIWRKPEIFLTEDEREWARQYLHGKGLDTSKHIVCLHPGSGHSSPNWEVGRYADLCRLFDDAYIQVLVTGSESEKDYEDAFAGTGGSLVKAAFGELSLRELAAVESQADVFVSSSTGPMHVAAAVGTPTVSMFCPLTACSPVLWGPIGNAATVILPPDGFCRTRCPGDPHVCTYESAGEGTKVETVFQAVMDLLKESEAQYSKDTSDDNSTGNRE